MGHASTANARSRTRSYVQRISLGDKCPHANTGKEIFSRLSTSSFHIKGEHCMRSWYHQPAIPLSQMAILLRLQFFLFATLGAATAFPSYGSLAGLTQRELAEIIPTLSARNLPSPPGPLKNTGTKLVNDPAHPFIAPGKNDIRGPCPGLNTLANHGVRLCLQY